MLQCKNCYLWRQSKVGLDFFNYTKGEDNKSKVVIVFDSPFTSDVRDNKFFSDRNYRTLLDEHLNKIGVSLDDCYTTSLLKCFISDTSKKPSKTAISKCSSLYLLEEIKENKPKIIIAIGAKSAKFFIPEINNLKEAVGKYFYSNIHESYIVPLFDLYYLSRISQQSSQFKHTNRAMQHIKYLMDSKVSYKEKVKKEFVIKVNQKYENLEKLEKYVAIDLETTGLSFAKDKILTLGISDLKQNIVFDVGAGGIDWKRIFKVLYTRKLVAHNAMFEMRFLRTIGIDIEDCLVGDTKIMQFLLNPMGATSLGFITQVEFGYSYKDTIDRSNMIAMKPKDRQQYCGTDTYFTIRAFYKLYKKLKERGSINSYKVFMGILKVLVHLEEKGMLIDTRKLNELLIYYNNEKEKSVNKFKKSFKLTEEFNLNSPLQLRKLIYGDLGLPVKIKTKTKQPSTKAKAIELCVSKKPALQKLVDYRLYKGNMEKLNLYNLSIKGDGRIHSSFSMFSPGSSRVMSAKPNLQNVNKGSRLKEIFIAPEGYSYIYFDFAQLEFRTWVHLSKDPSGIKFINEGKDIHRFIASRFFKKPESQISKDERDRCKQIVYGSLYGSTPEGVAREKNVPLEDAKQIQRIFFNVCKTGYFWMKNLENQIRRDKHIKTPFGTYRFFPEINMVTPYKREEMIRQGKNFIVQSWSGELVFIAMIKVHKAIKANNLDATFIHQIHDAGIIEVKNCDVDKGIEIVKENANNPIKLSIPLEVEIKKGTTWENLKEI
ncbi:hypothetical protein LCGC14_0667140 [marine sediment metagenome]|uniref:DNA-directed DNA polymerase family A palm domain-containing protein n=1 Tax=marine sediment metagenome TaxID=412755 RepID=A0A0F9RC41_9ZZZZ